MTRFALLASCFIAGVVSAQTVVDAPAYKQGDRWILVRDTDQGGVNKQRREVTAVDPDGNATITRGNGTTFKVDREGNGLDPRGRDYTAVHYRFPMKVGDEWRFRRIGGQSPYPWEEVGQVRVAAYEKVSVAAGTFDCFRLERTYRTSNKLISEQNDTTSWYCPEVKWPAREVSTRIVWDPYSGGPKGRTVTTTELVSWFPAQ